jgi:hypothetical protein
MKSSGRWRDSCMENKMELLCREVETRCSPFQFRNVYLDSYFKLSLDKN